MLPWTCTRNKSPSSSPNRCSMECNFSICLAWDVWSNVVAKSIVHQPTLPTVPKVDRISDTLSFWTAFTSQDLVPIKRKMFQRHGVIMVLWYCLYYCVIIYNRISYSAQNIPIIRGPYHQYGFTLILAWISNYVHHEVCDEIIYPFLTSNGNLGIDWLFLSDFTWLMVTYPYWD